jgi:hypothetical protein
VSSALPIAVRPLDFSASVLILPFCVLGIASLVIVAKVILGPISTTAGHLNAPTRFRLSDFFWLVVQIQILLAGLSQAFNPLGSDPFSFGLLLFGLIGATIAMWGGAVSCVSKAGVNDAWRRGVFIVWQLPATLTLMMAIPACFLGAVSMILESVSDRIPVFSRSVLILVAVYSAAFITMSAIAWGLRYVSKWVISGSSLQKELEQIESKPSAVSYDSSTPAGLSGS